jgi:hypothetical protein
VPRPRSRYYRPVRIALASLALAFGITACAPGRVHSPGTETETPEPDQVAAQRDGGGTGRARDGHAQTAGEGGTGQRDAASPLGGIDAPSNHSGGTHDAAAEAPRPSACARAQSSLICKPLGELPTKLSATGLYPSLPDLTSVASEAFVYRPLWELWSNGLDKQRFLVLPPDGVIDNRERALWEFPVGTLVFKTFFGLRDGRSYPIETRLIRRTDLRWEYAAYLWNSEGTEATLLELADPTPVGAGLGAASFEHQVPSRSQCRECHESNATVLIGIDELRLNVALEPGGPTLLERLWARGLLRVQAPSDPARITAADPTTLAVLGYVQGNCSNCHNGDRAFDMRYPVFLENTIGKPTSSPGTPEGIRVVPGKPDASILFIGLSRLSGVNPMPPIGIQRRDEEAVALFRRWITALE